MTAYLYIEGGGDSKEAQAECRKGFRVLLERAGFSGRMPRLVACGGRDGAFKDFRTALATAARGNYVAMLVDSEEPMTDVDKPWDHFARVTTVGKWTRPNGATDEQVLTMTTCMETWIVADRPSIQKHYDGKLSMAALPPENGLEGRDRHDVQDRLERATAKCSKAYQKGARSFEALAILDPLTLETLLPSFARVRRILNSKL